MDSRWAAECEDVLISPRLRCESRPSVLSFPDTQPLNATPDDMNEVKKAWSQAHDLALIFIALAYGTDDDLTPEELATITDILQDWRADLPVEEAQEIVMEAVAVYMDDRNEVGRSVEALREQLSAEHQRRALSDLVRVAEADGVLLGAEQDLIGRLASAWDLRDTARALLEEAGARLAGEDAWTLLHDIGLMYLVVAHSTDNSLSDPEIKVMVACLNDWQPGLSEDQIRAVLRRALEFYSNEPGPEALQRSVESVRHHLSTVHRLVLLDDLASIARADGSINELEEEMLAHLAQAWGVDIRLNGAH